MKGRRSRESSLTKRGKGGIVVVVVVVGIRRCTGLHLLRHSITIYLFRSMSFPYHSMENSKDIYVCVYVCILV